MSQHTLSVAIVEASHIVSEGLNTVLTKSGQSFHIFRVEGLAELQQIASRESIELVILNPALVQNQLKDFNSLKKDFESTLWVGMVYALFDQQLLSHFDDILSISDSAVKILSVINTLVDAKGPRDKILQHSGSLSEREIDVLKLLVEGNANKEIADKLNISTHTVISHRKNIAQKTNIKSVAGLTIYAVVNKIITVDSYE